MSTILSEVYFSGAVYSLRKQQAFGDAITGFPAKWRLWNERRNSILMTRYYPDLVVLLIGRAAREIWINQSEALPRCG